MREQPVEKICIHKVYLCMSLLENLPSPLRVRGFLHSMKWKWGEKHVYRDC